MALVRTFLAVPQDVIPLLEQRDRRISVAATATGSKPTPAVRLDQILGEALVTVPRLPHRF